MVSPITAQRDKLGDIECTKLTVVDAEGVPLVSLLSSENGGGGVVSKDGKLAFSLSVGEHGGRVIVRGKDDSSASLGINENGEAIYEPAVLIVKNGTLVRFGAPDAVSP